MAKAKNAFTEALDTVKRLTSTAGGRAGGAINQGLQQTANYFNPNVGVKQPTLKSPTSKFSPVPQTRSFYTDIPQVDPWKVVNNIPKAKLPQNWNPVFGVFGNPLSGPVGKANERVGQLARPMAEDMINTLPNMIQGAMRATGGVMQRNPQQILGGAGQYTMAGLNVVPVGQGTAPLKALGKEGIKKAALKGAAGAAAVGGVQGFARGLSENANAKSLGKQLKGASKEAIFSALLSVPFGAAVGGGSSVASKLSKRIDTAITEALPKATKEAKDSIRKQLLRDELGRFTNSLVGKPEVTYSGAAKDAAYKFKQTGERRFTRVEPNVLDKIRDKLGLPQSYASVLDDLQEKVPVGLSVKNIRKNEPGGGLVNPTQSFLPEEPKLPGKPQQALGQSGKDFVPSPEVPSQTSGQVIDQSNLPSSPYYNTARVGVSEEGKDLIQNTINQSAAQIDGIGGPKLGFGEVQAGARVSPELNKTFDREATAKLGEESLALRNKIATLAESGASPDQFQEALVKDKAFGMYVARLLGQRRIMSNPADKSIFNKIIGAILKEGHNPDEVASAAKNVNFDNPEEATKFFRTYIKAKKSEWIDAVRYSSMLSSPNTHINNTFSNLQGTGIVAPIEKTISGGIDFLRAGGAKALGKEYQRKHLTGEGLQYAAGYWSNVGNAAHKFADVMSGKSLSNMQELHNIPMSTSKGGRAVENVLTFPGKVLQATDEFFQTMTEAGSKKALNYKASKGAKVPTDIGDAAYKEGRKRLFNAEFNLPEEGPVLKALEFIPQKVMDARNSKNPVVSTVGKYTFPFVRIASNLLKGSVEYSPTGLLTIPGAANKTEQLSKSLMGMGIGLGTAMLVSSDRLSWAEPTDPKKKAAFRAAHMQPYAVKVGDQWLSYSKMHPVVGFNLALVSAVRDAQQKGRLNDSQVETVLTGLAKWANYFADASYVKNMGDIVSSAKGDIESPSRIMGNYVQQHIPFRALMGWVTRIVDHKQRMADPGGNILEKQLQQIASQIPGLSQTTPVRRGPDGAPLDNPHPFINSVSPVKVSTENPEGKDEFLRLEAETKERNYKADKKAEFEKQLVPRIRERYPQMTVEQKVTLIKLLKKTGHFNEGIKAELRAIEYDSSQQ